MDDRLHLGQPEEARGWDVGPDEDRMNVDVLSWQENATGEMEIQSQRMSVARPPNGIFIEPLDLTPGGFEDVSEFSTSTSTDRFYSEAARLASFRKNWLDDYNVRPADLARDGFVHIGPGDRVKCIFCLKTLRNWEPGDSVEGEHRRHYPDCPFVLGKCNLQNVPLSQSSGSNSLGLNIKHPQPPSSNPMQDFSQRLRSFDTWPKQAPVRPEALSEAGFFYCGYGDTVKCFSCQLVLSGWVQGDDPWSQHAQWSPSCAHLQSVKGSQFVQDVLKNVAQPQNPSGTVTSATNDRLKNGPAANEKVANVSSYKESNLKYPIPVSLQLDKDMRSPAVRAVMETYEVSEEDIRKRIEQIRLSNGPEYTIKHEDFSDMAN